MASLATDPAAVPPEPPADCALCPRLAAFRAEIAAQEPDWFNGAVPSFGDPEGRLLIVGLAPGLKGANRTGRPFTGDFAGDLLYATLSDYGFSEGRYDARPDDGLRLVDCLLTNAVRCLPPQNKPIGSEINTCRSFLAARIDAMPNLQAIVALGRIAFDSTVRALGAKPSAVPFGHGIAHPLDGVTLLGSYHCSRYNTNTGRLTEEMFRAVFASARETLR
jgi:uracil-DNA glycosylase family 4